MYRLALIALLFIQAGPASPPLPNLQFEAPPELLTVRARLQAIDTQRFADIAMLVGAANFGPPIQVIIAPENSDWAAGVAPWVSGYAVGASSLVVLFPNRSQSYPDNTIEDVLRHELTHVMIWRSAGGNAIPRWFDEGLAMAAERDRQFEDQTQLLYQLGAGNRVSLGDLNELFSGGQNEQIRAYVLAGALIHEVLQQYGPATPAAILRRVSQGIPFDDAFRQSTHVTPQQLDTNFWQSQRIWTTWVPILGSSTTLWLVITALALLAINARRQKNRQIEKRWEEEDRVQHGEDDLDS